MYAIEKRFLSFAVGCDIYGARNWVYDLYKDGKLISAAIGINIAKQFVPEFEE